MSRIIYKFTLELVHYQSISMPELYQVLDVQVQDGKICLWALVDEPLVGDRLETRSFYVYGTGDYVPWAGKQQHIGTVQMDELVFHIFMVR